ncbi:hypothetical protein ACA910_012824 [Epithemia clementina (nom. ined.)]
MEEEYDQEDDEDEEDEDVWDSDDLRSFSLGEEKDDLDDDEKSTTNVTRSGMIQFLCTKHKARIGIAFVAVCLFVFRKEIKYVLVDVIFKPAEKVLGKSVPFNNIGSVVKLLLILEMARRAFTVQQHSDGDNNPDEHKSGGDPVMTLAILLRSFSNPFHLLLLLPLLLKMSKGSSVYLPPVEQHYTFESINGRYVKDGMALERALQTASSSLQSSKIIAGGRKNLQGAPSLYKALFSSSLLSSKSKLHLHGPNSQQQYQNETAEVYNGTTILLDMTQLDSSVSQIESIRDKVSFLLSEHAKLNTSGFTSTSTSNDTWEVAVLLESPGGSASDYALAAQQLLRLRNHPKITVTVLVDKMAASGGYMIACASSPGRLFAAPFAVLGSIGVVGQAVNIQKTLEGWGVQPLVFRGGRDKNPIGLLGDITEEGLAKVQDMIDGAHRAFKRHVVESRPLLAANIEYLATGQTWLGYDAIHVGLIDKIMTSDDYIGQLIAQGALVLRLREVRQHRSLFSSSTSTESFGLGRFGIQFGDLPSMARRLSLFSASASSWFQNVKHIADRAVCS